MKLVYFSVSEAPKQQVKERKYESFNADTYKTDAQKREEVNMNCLYVSSNFF